MEDKDEKSRFFEKTFLLAKISIDIVLSMPFFILSNIEINIIDYYIYQKIYTITEVFLIP